MGTKSDQTYARAIDIATIRQLVNTEDCIDAYVETSAKTGKNVDTVFKTAVHLVLNDWQKKAKEIIQNDLIMARLNRYIKRIESSHSYKQGFWFKRDSRAINREANYLLAKELRERLEENPYSKDQLFSAENIANMRKEIIRTHGLFDKNNYVKREINSKDLKAIIKLGQS